MSFNVEEEFTTQSGLQGVVITCTVPDEIKALGLSGINDYRNGYVGVPPEHSLYGKEYDTLYDLVEDLPIELTYSGEFESPFSDSPLWLIGFDTNHIYDNDISRSNESVKLNIESLATVLAGV